jgi:mRNA-degrading endonuclease toxin of MazEF toxin-antitoxin module
MIKGEIWHVDLPAGRGHEQQGERPAIVMGFANNMVTVVPITSNEGAAKFPFTYVIEADKENQFIVDSVALVFQVVTLDKTRLKRRTGILTKEQQASVDGLLRKLLSL